MPVVLQVLPALKDGGVESSAIEMAYYLKTQNWTALVASAGGPKAALLARGDISHIQLPLSSKMPWIIMWNAVRLAKVIHQSGVSLVHARSRAPAWSAWLACKMTGVPYITTFHGTYGLSGSKLKRFYNSIMVRGHYIIANSHFIERHIIENYNVTPSRIIVAPRGIMPEIWNPALFDTTSQKAVQDELAVPNDSPLLLMAGRITRWKGHDLVLEALGQLTDLPWTLAIAGGADKDSTYADHLKARAEVLGIEGRIRWLGSRSDLPRLLSASQLAISGSTRPEAFGRVAIEAMAMGVPVVATGLGGSLETIVDDETGWLVMPESQNRDSKEMTFGEFRPQAMAEKLRNALQNPRQLASMGHAARARVLSKYTVEACCSMELLAYKLTLKIKEATTPLTGQAKPQ